MTCRELIKYIPLSNTIRDDVLEFFEKFIFYTHDGKDIRIKSGLYNDKAFSYGDYDIYVTKAYYKSTKIIKDKNKKINNIDTRDLRNDWLKKEKNNKCINAIMNDINAEFNYQLQFDREVVVHIDQDIFLGLCQEVIDLINSGILTENEKKIYTKFINKSHFRLDFFNSKYGINIEHDGSTYHIELLDNIRDKYLKIKFPNIIIIRVVDYMKYSNKQYSVDINERYKLITRLRDITNRHKLAQPLLIDFRDTVFIEYFKKYFLTLKHISDKLNSGYNTIEDLIRNNDEDFLSIDYHNNKPPK